MDELFTREGPRWGSMTENKASISDVLKRPAYILEGPHRWAYPEMIAAADTVIWMDFGFVPCVCNALRRRRAKARALRAGKPVPFGTRTLTSRARFWWGFMNTWLRDGEHLAKALSARPESQRLILLRSFKEAQAYLDSLTK